MAYESAEQSFFRAQASREPPLSRVEENLLFSFGRKFDVAKPRLEDFGGIYPESIIRGDLAYVKRRKAAARWMLASNERAHLLEAILWQFGEQQNWFGEQVMTAPTSEFDDVARGSDFVLELDAGKSTVRVAVDVTLANDISRFNEKWQQLLKFACRAGEDPRPVQLKYFRSELDPTFRGRVIMPHIILGMDSSRYNDLVQAISTGDKRALANHPVRELLLGELLAELNFLARTLPEKARKLFDKDIQGFLGVVRNELERREISSWAKNDTVFREIMRLTVPRPAH
ncbi:MAG: hypothetical protein HYS57_03150 [Parcubacteria group bacterium]|nr:hypothetical protein [Parcubacteria group bacterium]